MLPRLLRTGCVLLVSATLAGCGAGTVEQDRQADPTVVDSDMESSAPGAPVQCSKPPALPASVPTFQPGDTPLAGELGGLTARVGTTCGSVTLALDGAAAPQTVASFAFLAEQGYWTDSPCHRVTTEGIYVLQCGDPTGTGRGGPGYTFGIENAPPDGIYPRGTLAMARSQAPDSNGGQFFIVHQDTMLPVQGGGYTIFGKVVEGMDIIDQIATEGVDGGGADGIPAQPISITDVEIEEEASSS